MVILPSQLKTTSTFMVVFLMIANQHVTAYDQDLKEALLRGFQTLLQEKFTEFDYKLSQMNSTIGKLNDAVDAIANAKTGPDVKSALRNIQDDLSVVGQVISLIEGDKMTQLNVRMAEIDRSMVGIQEELTLVGGTINATDSRRVEADNTILNSIIVTNEYDNQKCEDGFIVGTQCFILYKDTRRTWSDAVDKCQAKGYSLAQPADSIVVPLRRYVLERYGDTCVWLNAQGNGTHMVWQDGKSEVNSESPLWFPKYPGTEAIPWEYLGQNFTTNYCLRMLAWQPMWQFSPEKPYISFDCNLPHLYTLCEMKLWPLN